MRSHAEIMNDGQQIENALAKGISTAKINELSRRTGEYDW
jgi:hypothetical protein